MKITFTSTSNRPTMIFDPTKFPEVAIKPEDAGIDAQTYMLTLVGKRLVQLIFELINFHPQGEITIKAVEKTVTVDTGLDTGLPINQSEFALLSHIIANLDNLTPVAFAEIKTSEIREFVQNEASRAGVNTDFDW